MEGLMRIRRLVIAVVAVASVGSACSGVPTPGDIGTTGPPSTVVNDQSGPLLVERLGAIDEAVATWRNADTIGEAHAAAESAANLVVGPNGPGYGDRDGDGTINGISDLGLLAGLDGTPTGVATPWASSECIAADVLGGTWLDPGKRWGEMSNAIGDWRPDHNTMPSLASHPMRIVGWSTFTLESDSLDLAREYAGHAKLHIDISLRALNC
jgi:hypothetical protein